MRRALIVAGALAVLALPAEAGAIKLTTNKDRECHPTATGSIGAGTATYAVRLRNDECEPAIELVKSSIWLSQDNQALEDSRQREVGPLNYENEKTHPAMGSGHTAHLAFSVILRDSDARRPQRWRRKTGPDYCQVTTTFRSRDTVVCSARRELN